VFLEAPGTTTFLAGSEANTIGPDLIPRKKFPAAMRRAITIS
jgi:hypothetical protein